MGRTAALRRRPGTSWLQWIDRFRDDVRSWVKSDPGIVGGLMARLYGSDDVFPDAPDDAFHAYQSVNFVTAHDGFCLYDLVSYNDKHNEANGENNRDGTGNNNPYNQDSETTWLDWEPLSFRIQEGAPQDWLRVVDTSLPGPDDIREPGHEVPVQSLDYVVAPRSVVVLTRV